MASEAVRAPALINRGVFLLPFGLVCVGLLLASAWGLLP